MKREVYSPEVSVSSSTDNDTNSTDTFIALYNDWDLDAAFLNASQPYLSINVELKSADHMDNVFDEWEVIHSTESVLSSNHLKRIRLNETKETNKKAPCTVHNRSFISNAADRAVSVLNRMFSFSRSNSLPSNDQINLFEITSMEQGIKSRLPLADAELRNFMDSDGRIVQANELKQRIFEGGCEASRRPFLWPILLDIYPNQQMTSEQRRQFIEHKSAEYKNLKYSLWYNGNKLLHQNSSQMVSDSSFDSNYSDDVHKLHNLAHKIYKDVWRTDRNHKFYSGECNKNTEAMFNVLMTYTLSNRGQPYCQGMSDLLSPLLYVLKDEALAYICFCSLMARCSQNFQITSDSITAKIRLLAALIQRFDPQLWSCLSEAGADQLLFVYRWLLLECKREFPFVDSLRVFEIMWSSLPINHKPVGSSFQMIRDAMAHDQNDLNTLQTNWLNNNNNCSDCKICQDKKNDTEIEFETDTESERANIFDYYKHLRKNKEIKRRRRFSLNSSFYAPNKTKTNFKPSSLNVNCFLSGLREQQIEEKKLIKTRRPRASKMRTRSLHCLTTSRRQISGAVRSRSESNLRASYGHTAKKVPTLFVKQLKSSLLHGSARLSEADSVRKQRPSSTSSELSDDLNKLAIAKMAKTKKKAKQIEQKLSKKILFKNIKKSLEKSHLHISKKFAKYKSSTSSKSSTSAYVSAGSALSSSSSSSNNEHDKPRPGSASIAIKAETERARSEPLDDDQLVYELSKLDNPFLLFVCLAMFVENREVIVNSQMDSNDIACFFDKMARKHNAKNVLVRARHLYTKLYLAKVNAFSYIQQLMDIQNSP